MAATVPTDAKAEFLKSLSPRGVAYFPDHKDYEDVKKVWNGFHDKVNPHAVVRVTGTADVQACIKYAQKGLFICWEYINIQLQLLFYTIL